MSSFFFLASDTPFKKLINPHEKIISINEALVLGVEIPDYALNMDLDRDKPILLYMDREILRRLEKLNQLRLTDSEKESFLAFYSEREKALVAELEAFLKTERSE